MMPLEQAVEDAFRPAPLRVAVHRDNLPTAEHGGEQGHSKRVIAGK